MLDLTSAATAGNIPIVMVKTKQTERAGTKIDLWSELSSSYPKGLPSHTQFLNLFQLRNTHWLIQQRKRYPTLLPD